MHFAATHVFDADRLAALEEHTCRLRARLDDQVRAAPRGPQETLGGAPSKTLVGRLLKIRDAFLRGAVVVLVERDADILCGRDEVIGDRPAQPQVRNLERSAHAVEFVCAALLILRLP